MTVLLALVPFVGMSAKKKVQQQSDREYWCSLAYKMAQPVLENMAKGELQKNMQTEFSPSFDNRNKKVLYMECFGRLMAGVAPWLTLPDENTAEGKQRKQLREWALASYKNAVDPQNPDYLCWGIGGQNLVDAAYIAESFLRAYDTLWKPLDEVTKKRYLTEFAKLRHIPTGCFSLLPSRVSWRRQVATTTNIVSTRLVARWKSGMWVMAGIPMVLSLPSTTTVVMCSIRCTWRPCRRW